MKTYQADREKWGRAVKVIQDGEPSYWLDPKPSQLLINHSPDGFEWSYGGSGPAQLALAILLDHLGEKNKSKVFEYYHSFKDSFVAGFATSGFMLPGDLISLWLRGVEKREVKSA